jgi:hypothetical protein
MKSFKFLPILILAITLTGCFDRGSRTPVKSCDETSSTLGVEGFSNEQKAQHKELQATYALFPKETLSALSKNDQITECLEQEIAKSPAKQNAIEIIKPYVTVISTWLFEVPFWLIVAYIFWALAINLPWILATNPQLPNKKDDKPIFRYPVKILRMNAVKLAVLFFLFIPSSVFNLGGENTNLLMRLVKFPAYVFGLSNMTYGTSTAIAESERGQVELTKLSESSQSYSALAFRAWSCTNTEVKGQLRDNRTAKAEYHEALPIDGKYSLPVEHPDSMQYIYPSNNKIEFKRYSIQNDDRNKTKVRSQLSFSGSITFDSKVISQEAYKIIANSPDKYIANTPSEIPAKAELIKAAMIQKFGQEISKKPEVLNKAVIQVVKSSMQPMIENWVMREQSSIKEITRLVEEMNCTYVPISPEIQYNNSQFIKRVAAGDFWGKVPLINSCIGQKGSTYISYGQRNILDVKNELNAKYKALYDRNYEYLVSISAATKGITIDNTAGNYCQKARNSGLSGFIQYFNLCERSNTEQRELTDHLANSFSCESVGVDHYIDTETRKNDDYYKGLATFINDDFDPIIEALFKSVKMNATYGDIPTSEYTKAIADAYDVSKANDSSMTNMFFSPIETLRSEIAKANEDNPLEVKNALKAMYLKGVKVGTYLLGAGLGASAIDSMLELNKNKTSKTDAGYSGKGDGKLRSLFSGFFKLIAASTWLGLVTLYSCLNGLFFYGIGKLLFYILSFTYFANFIFSLFNSTYEAAKYFTIDDENNLSHHGNKLFNDTLYLILTPSLIAVMYLLNDYIQAEYMVSVAHALLQYPTNTLMESIAFIGMACVFSWTVQAVVLVTMIKALSYFDKELFGRSENNEAVRFVNESCMFVIRWSLPFMGSLIFRILHIK